MPNICLLDNGLCFIHCSSAMTTLDDNIHNSSFLEIENIFETFPEEDIRTFNSMYYTVDEPTLRVLISKTEAEIGKPLPNKESYLCRFRTVRTNIDTIRSQKHKTKEIA